MFEMGANLDEDPLEKQGQKGSGQTKPDTTVLPKEQHRLVFTFERRRGKPVTLVGRFYLEQKQKKKLLKMLKTKLASGGKIAGEWLELQGDCKDRVKEILQEHRWPFKK